jgi:hypothetical protein
VAQSDSKFLLPDIRWVVTSFEFIKKNGKVTKLIARQEKQYVWEKTD